MRTSIVITAALMLAACATTHPDWSNPGSAAAGTTVERDDFKKVTSWVGPNCASARWDYVVLRAFREAGGAAAYQIYVMDYYDDGAWRFYDQAYDSQGRKMDLSVLARDVGHCSGTGAGCSHFETIGLRVTREYLEAAASTGIHFQVEGRRGKAQFVVPAGYVQGFLQVAAK